jgi:hypothetical protein
MIAIPSRRTLLLLTLALLLLIVGCRTRGPYLETFDAPGQWRVGDDLDAAGQVVDGVYRFDVRADVGIFWTTAGESFRDGLYSVEVVQRSGPIDAGYGLMWRVDDKGDNFYLFQISGDGYAWIGRCAAGCAEETNLVGTWWFETPAINQGLNARNVLSVQAESGNFIFRVNDMEIGRVTDNSLPQGDIGLFVETLGRGNVRVEFDNFQVTNN